jgi:hypothetical protein
LAEAAYGSLKPLPTERLRRAHLHLSYSRTISRLLDTTRLSDFETKGVIPSVYRLYSLAVIYRSDFKELLKLYDVDIDQTTSDVRSLEQILPLTRVALAERTIGGRVILKRKIGQGSLSSVWDAVDSTSGVRVVKVFELQAPESLTKPYFRYLEEMQGLIKKAGVTGVLVPLELG